MKNSLVKHDDATWLVMPDQVDGQLHEWRAQYPDRFQLVSEDSPSGYAVHAVQAGPPPDTAVPEVLIVQPHGHEPAATAAIMELLSELITGRHLDGSLATLPHAAMLDRCRFMINPLGNPDGRRRMPARCWTNEFGLEEAIYYSNGKELGGTYLRGPRKQVMRAGEIALDPDYPLACRWEHCGDGLYVDPWGWPGDFASNPATLVRLLQKWLPGRSLTLVLDMHQVEADVPEVWVPKLADQAVNDQAAALAAKLEATWQAAGYQVGARHPYSPPHFIRGLHESSLTRPPLLTVEIGMGVGQTTPQMTPDRQKEAGLLALHTAIESVLTGGLQNVVG